MARFALHVWNRDHVKVPVMMSRADRLDLAITAASQWQTDWTSEYITASQFAVYALKTGKSELVALGAYEVQEDILTVHIIYMEGQAKSNPTRTAVPKYRGIGRVMVAYGIKLSVDAGFNGDVTLDAKTSELARHYERDFCAFRVPGRTRDAAPRYLIL